MTEPKAEAVRWGAGRLLAAPLGSPEPADLVVPWDEAWLGIGYTEDGSEQTFTPTITDIDVAEEDEPIARVATKVVHVQKFTCAEMTVASLERAFNGGTITPILDAGTPVAYSFEPPPRNQITRIMLGWESDDGLERWFWRRVFQTGTITIPRRKAAKANIPTEWTVEKPAGAVLPFKGIFAASLRGDVAA